MKKIIYSEFYNDIHSEENLKRIQDSLISAYTDKYKCAEDISKKDIEKEVRRMLEKQWKEIEDTILGILDTPFIWYGYYRGWRGRDRGYCVTDKYDEVLGYDGKGLIPEWGEIRFVDENGILIIEGFHNNGDFYFEGKSLTKTGINYVNEKNIPYNEIIEKLTTMEKASGMDNYYSDMARIFNYQKYSTKPCVGNKI